MFKGLGLTLLVAAELALSGCAGVSGNISVKCGSGSGCEGGGSISFPTNLAQARVLANVPIDAAGVLLDTSGSTITYPSTGTVILSLYNASGSVLASKSFPWVLSGTALVFANPAAVNQWESANSNGVTQVNYQLTPFTAGYAAGTNTMSIATTYQGLTLARATSTFSSNTGSRCASCRQQ